jgi:hypothetical protein
MPNYSKLPELAKALAAQIASAYRSLPPEVKGAIFRKLLNVSADYVVDYIRGRKHSMQHAATGHAHVHAALHAERTDQVNDSLRKAIENYKRHIKQELSVDEFYSSLWISNCYVKLMDDETAASWYIYSYQVGAKLFNEDTRARAKGNRVLLDSTRAAMAECLDGMVDAVPQKERIKPV